MPQHHEGTAVVVGASASMQEIASRLPTLAKTDDPVLISGETGTGKALVCRAIHELSPRASSRFVAVSCGALDERLDDARIFGDTALGTVMLDDVEMLTPRAQAALLRVLQDHAGMPDARAGARFLVTTTVRLDRLVQSGEFRADLYYRLCVFSLELRPLRERRDDILPLVDHFLAKHPRPSGDVLQLAPSASEALLTFDWPGNVRELESAIVRAVHLAAGNVIEARDLGLPDVGGPCVSDTDSSYKAQKRRIIDAFDRQYLLRIMTEHRGNVSRAARAAGKERRDLGRLLKRHGVDPRQFAGKRSTPSANAPPGG
jgi:DNA-binding NtrC family response regulator